jgi:hypothetical protein
MQQDKDRVAAKAVREDVRAQWGTCKDKAQRAIVFNLDARVDRWETTKAHLLSVGICPARFSACSDKDVVELTSSDCEHGAVTKQCHRSDMAKNGSL